jgi:hypothetical protein
MLSVMGLSEAANAAVDALGLTNARGGGSGPRRKRMRDVRNLHQSADVRTEMKIDAARDGQVFAWPGRHFPALATYPGQRLVTAADQGDRCGERRAHPGAARGRVKLVLGGLAGKLCAVLLVVGLAFGGDAPAAAQAGVDLQLVLAVDVSGSVSEERFKLQQQGYAKAFRSWRVLEAIRSGSAGAIAVTMTHWTGPSQQAQVVPWMVISDEASMIAIAEAIERTTRQLYAGGTSISGAIDHAMTSGWFAVIANERQFTLVRWRDILERFRGREVAGLVRGMSVSWQLGLQRGRGLSRSL